ncbi:MAG: STAS domain-containing protein [Magnetococcus sp. DMHC-6]
MSIIVEKKTGHITIKIQENFTYKILKEFRNAFTHESNDNKFTLDMASVKSMDSAALGMLLLLREHAGTENIVTIVNCRDELKKLLKIANFSLFFDIK